MLMSFRSLILRLGRGGDCGGGCGGIAAVSFAGRSSASGGSCGRGGRLVLVVIRKDLGLRLIGEGNEKGDEPCGSAFRGVFFRSIGPAQRPVNQYEYGLWPMPTMLQASITLSLRRRASAMSSSLSAPGL